MEPRPRQEWMTVPQAGARLGLKPRAAYVAARRGRFPVIRMGRRVVVSTRAFEEWLAEGGRQAMAQPRP